MTKQKTPGEAAKTEDWLYILSGLDSVECVENMKKKITNGVSTIQAFIEEMQEIKCWPEVNS